MEIKKKEEGVEKNMEQTTIEHTPNSILFCREWVALESE